MTQQSSKPTIETYLKKVDYKYLNSNKYIPSDFALKFLNFIKLVNSDGGETNKTPAVHLAMLDKIANSSNRRIVNLIFRGAAKALSLNTLVITPKGEVTVRDIKVGDTLYGIDGKECKVTAKSEIFNKDMYKIELIDGRTLEVSKDHLNVVEWKPKRGYERDTLTTEDLYKKFKSGFTIGIPVIEPVEYKEKELPVEPYTLGLILGNFDRRVSECYPSIILSKEDVDHVLSKCSCKVFTKSVSKSSNKLMLIPQVLKQIPKFNFDLKTKRVPKEYLNSSIQQRLELLKGILDTGCVPSFNYKLFKSHSLGLVEDVINLVRSLGGIAYRAFKYELASKKLMYKAVISLPFNYLSLPSKVKRYNKPSKTATRVRIKNITPIQTVPSQCLAVDNQSHTFLVQDYIPTHNTTLFGEYLTLYCAVFNELPRLGEVHTMIYVGDSVDNGVKSLRKNIEHRYNNSEFLQKYLPQDKAVFTDRYIEFTNISGGKFGLKLFGASSGIRGTKIFGRRPQLCVADDVMSDEAATSKATLEAIKNTLYNGVMNAVDPTNNLIIFNGTPFNKEDVIVEAVESGAWDVNAYPVCQNFPCSKEEFVGAWEDRFTYEYILDMYNASQLSGRSAAFYRELMLQITPDEERLVTKNDLRWFDRDILIKNSSFYNFYITTDFATSARNSADYSVIAVWAYNANGDLFLVDGICKRQSMDKNIDALFMLAQRYKPQAVGVEVTGQQGGFIPWIQQHMMLRNCWFNLASANNSNLPGIRPTTDKLSRFNLTVPWFKAGKMYFARDNQNSELQQEMLNEINLVTIDGIKGKDDCLDVVSMLAVMKMWRPSESIPIDTNIKPRYKEDSVFDPQPLWDNYEPNPKGTYLV